MNKKEFKIGDKVKIPKSKSVGLNYLEFAAEIVGLDYTKEYLIITKIEGNNSFSLELDDKYKRLCRSQFCLIDLEHYKEEFVLPEKWCIKLDSDNYKTLNPFYIEAKGYHHSNKIRYNNWSDKIEIGYTEITLEQFKKYVLKEVEIDPIDIYKIPGTILPKLKKDTFINLTWSDNVDFLVLEYLLNQQQDMISFGIKSKENNNEYIAFERKDYKGSNYYLISFDELRKLITNNKESLPIIKDNKLDISLTIFEIKDKLSKYYDKDDVDEIIKTLRDDKED